MRTLRSILTLSLLLLGCSTEEVDISATVVSMDAEGIVLEVSAMPDARVSVFQKSVKADERGELRFTLPLDAVPKGLDQTRTLNIEATDRGFLSTTFGNTTVDLPMSPREARELPQGDAAEVLLISSNARTTLTFARNEGAPIRAKLEDTGALQLTLRGPPGAQVSLGDATTTVSDAGEGALRWKAEDVMAMWRVEEMNEISGPPREMTLKVSLGEERSTEILALKPSYVLRKVAARRVRERLDAGRGWPASGDPSREPIVFLLPPHQAPLQVVGRGGPLSQADFIAVATVAERRDGDICYSRKRLERDATGALRDELPSHITNLTDDTIPVRLRQVLVDWEVRLHDAHSLEVIATETFEGGSPCPQTTFRDENDRVDSPPPEADIHAWLKRQAAAAE